MKSIDPERVERVLVRATNWVGDAVMSVPALRETRRAFPRARISLVVRPWVRDVYAAADFVDELLVFDKSGEHAGLKGLAAFAGSLKARRFEVAILLQNAFEAALMAWLARIPHRVGYARDARSLLLTHPLPVDPDVRRVHQAYYYLGILSGAGWMRPAPWSEPRHPVSIRLGVTDKDREAAGEMLRRLGLAEGESIVGINPGAYYGSAKRWLIERYAAVGEALRDEYGVRIVIFGSPAEAPIGEAIGSLMSPRPAILAGKTTLGQLMALIASCRLFITNDSGPMHLAAALDVPQVAIFGSTSDAATGPLSANATVVRTPVDCSPCFRRECPIDLRCMTRVTVDQVLIEARLKLQR
jgi:heptosyltransferase II